MKVWIARFSAKLKTLSPAAICALGLIYVLVLACIDHTTPGHLSFYCLGAAFVGWGAGKRQAAVVSLAASIIILGQGWEAYQTAPHAWLALWNTVRRIIVVWSVGWVAAELSRLTRTLGRLVAHRTARWKAEAQRHKTTAESLRLFLTERERLERQILEISDREQARMGQDLHDGLCQQLVSLAFDANSLEDQLANPHPSQAVLARRLADGLDQAITEARQLSRGLFPIRLAADGLPPALEELARSVRERCGLDCRFESHGDVAVADRVVATHLYRIAQEAVNNALKHARPSRITIHLQANTSALELTVRDDGCGIPAEAPQSSAGMGLHIMEYRARTIGATLWLAPGAPAGTTVTCRLPHPRGHANIPGESSEQLQTGLETTAF